MSHSWNADELRTRFTLALSEMYRKEVPLYGTLVQIVEQIDGSILAAKEEVPAALPTRHQLERHDAIRLGTEYELCTIRRLFALFGMSPVGYYDLRVIGLPLHATAFRPISEEAMEKNPFRVFTTVLRKDMLPPKIRETTARILTKRNLFTTRLLEIIDRAEAKKVMTFQDAEDLIADALEIFKWHSRSMVTLDEYLALKNEHPIIADITCFPGAHVNHLTPTTRNIDLVQKEMTKQSLPAKDRIEGPPYRQCPILLRQTSFKALEEYVGFNSPNGTSVPGTHTARFGEVEQRGAAVTRKGRKLYDHLLSLATRDTSNAMEASRNFDDILADTFSSYPDTWLELQAQDLVYFRYQVTSVGRQYVSERSSVLQSRVSLEHVLSLGLIEYEPIRYEDFLPFSAAGIFQSNVRDEIAKPVLQEDKNSSLELEEALGCKILDEFNLYSRTQQYSLECCAKALNLEEIVTQ